MAKYNVGSLEKPTPLKICLRRFENNLLFSFLPQVYIERTRCLVHPDNDTELVDPMIGIYTFGKKQYTPAKK